MMRPENREAMIEVIKQAHQIHSDALLKLTTEFTIQIIGLMGIDETIKKVIFIPARRHIMVNPSEKDYEMIKSEGLTCETIWPKPAPLTPISDADGTSAQADPVLPGPL